MNDTAVAFQTKGDIEQYAYSIFGVSAKTNDNPIGLFGTGLKYAIAVILASGGKITIYNGLDHTVFGVINKSMRNQSFGVIYANDEPLPFTTHLGNNWEPWMAFRELYCNTIDEGGKVGTMEELFPEEGFSTIIVEHESFPQFLKDKDDIVIPSDEEPVFENEEIAIYEGISTNLYYRGVRANELSSIASYRYSFKTVELTEDRTIKSMWLAQYELNKLILQDAPEKILKKIFSAGKNSYESHLSFDGSDPSDVFLEVVASEMDIDRSRIADAAIRAWEKTVPMLEKVRQCQDVTLSGDDECCLDAAIKTSKMMGLWYSRQHIIIKDSLPGHATSATVDDDLYIVYDRGSWNKIKLAEVIAVSRAVQESGYSQGSGLLTQYITKKFVNHVNY